MQIKEYQEKIKRTLPDLGSIEKNNIHLILGIVTESSELANIFKANLAYNKSLDWANIIEELGDLEWFILNFCTINNIDIEKVFDKNIAKLESRYPEKFTEYDAIHRDLNKERKVLEK